MQPTPIHESVREHYAGLARSSNSCCGDNTLYDAQILKDLPPDVSGFSLGCGDPITLANLRSGETVLDLGSGGGLDCFLAAKQVGEAGHVIGVDMTPDMLAKARANAERLHYSNVEFREGYLEALPVDDASIDVVISNCVINLSPDKPQVFREIFRVLRSPDVVSGKPGGRVAVSDIVTNGQLPAAVQQSMAAWGACVAGALDAKDYVRGLHEAGFADVRVQPKSKVDQALAALPIGVPYSATITAYKPVSGATVLEPADDHSEVAQAELASTGFEQLLGQVAALEMIDGGYDLRISGDTTEIRELVNELSQAAECCSPLRFSVVDAADGAHVHITQAPAAAFVATSDIACGCN